MLEDMEFERRLNAMKKRSRPVANDNGEEPAPPPVNKTIIVRSPLQLDRYGAFCR